MTKAPTELYEFVYKRNKQLANFRGRLADEVEGKPVKLRPNQRGETPTPLLAVNGQHILNFLTAREASGLKAVRLLKYGYNLATIARMIDKDLAEFDRGDVEELVLTLKAANFKPHTLKDLQVALKVFFKWLRKTEDDYPDEVRWLKPKAEETPLSEEDLPTDKEIKRMIDAAFTIRDKCFISVLADSGARVGELLTLTLDRVHKKQNKEGRWYYLLDVFGKTGRRQIPVFECVSYLDAWLAQHPLGHRPSAPLFVKLTNNKPLVYDAAYKILAEAAERAKIKKHMHPHLLRHFNSNKLGDVLSEKLLNARQGWVQGSRMPATYLHIKQSARVEQALTDMYARQDAENGSAKEVAEKLAGLIIGNKAALTAALSKLMEDKTERAKFNAIWKQAQQYRP